MTADLVSGVTAKVVEGFKPIRRKLKKFVFWGISVIIGKTVRAVLTISRRLVRTKTFVL